MKFGLLMNVIILYHYLQYKDIGISYPFYLILLFCLLSKGVNAQYINLSSWKVFFSTEQFSWPKCLEHLLPQKQTLAAKGNKQIFKLSASNVWRSWPRWFYWQLLNRHILNWKCRITAALWEPTGSQWFYVFFMANLTLTFVLGIKSPHKTGSIQACCIWFH